MGWFTRIRQWFRPSSSPPVQFETITMTTPIIEDIYRLHPYEWEYVVTPGDHIYAYLHGNQGTLRGYSPDKSGIVKIVYQGLNHYESMEWNPIFHTYRSESSVSTILMFFARPPCHE
jgi:hypothetical protein